MALSRRLKTSLMQDDAAYKDSVYCTSECRFFPPESLRRNIGPPPKTEGLASAVRGTPELPFLKEIRAA
jgi:hypothetical protein